MDELVPLTCKNCGSSLPQLSPGQHFLVCKFCGTSYDLLSEAPASRAPKPPPRPEVPALSEVDSRLESDRDDLPETRNRNGLLVLVGIVVALGVAGAAAYFHWKPPAKATAHFRAGALDDVGADVTLVSGDKTITIGPLPSTKVLDLGRTWTLVAKKHGYLDMRQQLEFGDDTDKTFSIWLHPIPCAPDGSNGCLPKAVVQAFVESKLPSIRYCFANSIGTTGVQMQVNEDGHVVTPPATNPPGFLVVPVHVPRQGHVSMGVPDGRESDQLQRDLPIQLRRLAQRSRELLTRARAYLGWTSPSRITLSAQICPRLHDDRINRVT